MPEAKKTPLAAPTEGAAQAAGKAEGQIVTETREAFKPTLEQKQLIEDIVERAKKNKFDFNELKDIDPKLHRLIALRLIKTEVSFIVAGKLDKFQVLDHKEIVKLLAKKDPGSVITFLTKINEILGEKSEIATDFAKYIRHLDPTIDAAESLREAQGILKTCVRVEVQFGVCLHFIGDLFERNPALWGSLIYPTIMSQQTGAHLCLDDFKSLANYHSNLSFDTEKKLAKKYRAINADKIEQIKKQIEAFKKERDQLKQKIENFEELSAQLSNVEREILELQKTTKEGAPNEALDQKIQDKQYEAIDLYDKIGPIDDLNEKISAAKIDLEILKHPLYSSEEQAKLDRLDALASLKDEKVVALLKFITTQLGIKAHDILKNFIIKGVDHGEIKNLSEESELIREFLESDAIPILEIYEGYRAAKAQNKPELYREIVEVTKALQKKIAEGTCEEEDFNNRFFPGLVMYTFPPAIGVEREQYANLIHYRVDRQADVPRSLDELQGKTISIARGGYKLKEGEEMDMGAWQILLKTVEEDKKSESAKFEKPNLGKLGKEIGAAFSGGTLKKEQEKFLKALYQVYRSRGQSLPDSLSGHRELMAYKEYVGDHLNDLIGLLLQAWEKEDPKGFEEWQKAEVQKRSKDVKGLAKQLTGVLTNEKMDENKKAEVLKRMLGREEFRAEGDIAKTLAEELEKGNLEEFLRSKLEGKGNAQKFNLLIKNALLGKEYSRMYEEMQKFEFEEGAEKQEYQLFVTKKREHGCAGLNMGVCVAPDEKLWENPNFMNVIIMKDGIAYGGMHFLIVEEAHEIIEEYDDINEDLQDKFDDYRYQPMSTEPVIKTLNPECLTLPGINPNEALLGQAAADDIFDELIDYAKACAKAMGCEKVLIPKATAIHSNRSAIQQIIASRNYPDFDFGEVIPFSYDPYEYSFQECWEITD